ncbi:hypothetical protein ACI2JA_03630 [Alkalihalobacillus sp. NPDC078783]
MIYDKIWTKEAGNGGFHKRRVRVDKNRNVTAGLLEKDSLAQFAVELSKVKGEIYKRTNPYRFVKKNRNIHIEYAVPLNQDEYIVRDKMILKISNTGNFSVADRTFLYDLLDYFATLGYLDKKSYSATNVGNDAFQVYTIGNIATKEQLKFNKFVFPNQKSCQLILGRKVKLIASGEEGVIETVLIKPSASEYDATIRLSETSKAGIKREQEGIVWEYA